MRRALPYLIFGALTFACFWRFLLLGWTLYDVRTLEGHLGTRATETPGWFEAHRPSVDRGDTVLSLPMLHRLYGEGLHHGELRLWNPYLFCGYPIYNNLLLHPFYPPNLVLHSLLPSRAAYDLNLMLHFFFSGAAMFWLLRGWGRSVPAALAGGLLWMMLGYNAFWFSTGTVMGASVFAPLALLGLQRGLARRDLKPVALAGLAMGMVILGSHGQHALHVLILFSLWLVISLIRDRGMRPFIAKAGAIFIAAALGSGMAAILTQLDSVLNGLRIPGEDAQLHYAAPWTLPVYIAGVALGKVCFPPDGLLRSEFTIYAGAAGTMLAILGAVRGAKDPFLRFLSFVTIAALLVAFVKPLAEVALAIPFLNLSMPARWVYVFGFCFTLLGAAGFDAFLDDPAKSFRITAICGCLFLILFAFSFTKGAGIETLAGFALAACWIVTARSRRPMSLALCFAAILADLLPNFALFNRHADPRPLEQAVAAVEAVRKREPGPPWRATGSLRLDGGPAGFNGWTASVGNNLLATYGVEAVMGYESIAPLSAVQYCIAMSGRKAVMGSGRVLAVTDLESRLLDMANVKYVFMPFVYDPDPRFRRIGAWGPLTVYENPAAVSRAYLVSRAFKAEDENEVGRIIGAADFDPRTMAVLQSAELPRVGSDRGEVEWKSAGTDRFTLIVDAKSDSVLVVADTDYPGWEAEIDGRPAPILRANLSFRAVAVPQGVHQVTMRFCPGSARNGLIVTLLSIGAVLAYCGWKRKTV